MFTLNNDLTSTDVTSEASDGHHRQSESQGHLRYTVVIADKVVSKHNL